MNDVPHWFDPELVERWIEETVREEVDEAIDAYGWIVAEEGGEI